ncbi:MAG: N-acetyl-gamma-glutamyl-phosphate reductase [Gammaproteobacteria bacterium]|nr:MAG: N-acetyl-gamma-glutamyl-phosphate reductase [Gammaproteobacteria bacterium]RLA16080.1 MAG: N-acetyl-gamma-glutamyl-phosphate reductase [Gammaproteobacteria bacterium]
MISVGVVGGSGYTGGELLRLLLKHPSVKLSAVTSRTLAGTLISESFPNLRGVTDLEFASVDLTLLGKCDVVFFATPNGVAMKLVPELLEAGVKVVDLAADFRLKDPAVWEKWYGQAHTCPELLEEAVYGLPELNRVAISAARLVAAPGCYPTAVTLGLLPIVEAGLDLMGPVIADTKSGVSGAGRNASVDLLFCEVTESLHAYNVFGHRHQPEISQTLASLSDSVEELVFVPHLVPMLRGIHATLYLRVGDGSEMVRGLYEQRYRSEPFVDLLPSGAHPRTRNVRGSNLNQIAVHQQGSQVIVLSVIDNLMKGAAGQAVQCMNLMFGLDESLGLAAVAQLP